MQLAVLFPKYKRNNPPAIPFNIFAFSGESLLMALRVAGLAVFH